MIQSSSLLKNVEILYILINQFSRWNGDWVKEWSSPNYQVSPEDINCTGCHAGSQTVFKFCNECEIRMCGVDKEIDNCGYCNEYPCSKLDISFNNSPENKERLDQIKIKSHKNRIASDIEL